MEKIYTTEQVAELLAVHPDSIRAWLRTGELRGIKLPGGRRWRVLERDLQEFILKLDTSNHEQKEGK